MGFIAIFKDTFVKSIKPKLPLKGIIKDQQEKDRIAADRANDIPVVGADVTEEEFKARYSRLVSAIYISMAAALFCGYNAIAAGGLLSLTICVLLMAVCTMFLVKYSYIAWMARQVYQNWEFRDQPRDFYFNEYVNNISNNFKEILPRKLTKKTGE